MSNAFFELDEGSQATLAEAEKKAAVALPDSSNGAILPPKSKSHLPIISKEMSVQGQLFTDLLDEATALVLTKLNSSGISRPSTD